MRAQIKAELRKLLTVRSTYVLLGVAFLAVILVNFWAVGYKFVGQMPNTYVADAVTNSFIAVGMFAGIIAVLLVTHEYRYNTIFYTLTLARSRTAVLVSKVAVLSLLSVFYMLLLTLLTIIAVLVGLKMGNHAVTAQVYNWGEIFGLGLLYIWGICMLGFIFATIVRNQIGSIVLFLFLPNTIEGLASLLLKDRVAYLPFTALNNVIMNNVQSFSVTKSAIIFLVWAGFGLFVSWVLFTRRDAN
jgi:ABC-type transport system involved in multi-copper enzyme maturation permease subunit